MLKNLTKNGCQVIFTDLRSTIDIVQVSLKTVLNPFPVLFQPILLQPFELAVHLKLYHHHPKGN